MDMKYNHGYSVSVCVSPLLWSIKKNISKYNKIVYNNNDKKYWQTKKWNSPGGADSGHRQCRRSKGHRRKGKRLPHLRGYWWRGTWRRIPGNGANRAHGHHYGPVPIFTKVRYHRSDHTNPVIPYVDIHVPQMYRGGWVRYIPSILILTEINIILFYC